MEHTEIRRRLSDYLDNAVDAADRARIEAHLAQCDNCRRALVDLERTVGHLRSIPEVEPPPWLTARIMAHVRDAAVPKPSLWRRFFMSLRVKLPIEVFAIFVVCVTGYYIARMNAPQAPLTSPFPPTSEESPRPLPAPEAQGKAPAPSGHIPPKPQAAAGTPQGAPQQQDNTQIYAPPPPVKTPAPPPPPMAAAPASAPSLPPYGSSEPEEWIEAGRGAGWEARRDTYDAARQTMQKSGMPDEPPYSTQASGGSSGSGYHEPWSQPSTRKAWEERAAGWNPPEQQARVEVILRVGDPAAAAATIEQAVIASGGRITRRLYGEESHLLSVRIAANKLGQLVGRLKRIGTLVGPSPASDEVEGEVDLAISW